MVCYGIAPTILAKDREVRMIQSYCRKHAILTYLVGSFTSLNVTDSQTGSLGATVNLQCSITYPSVQNYITAMPSITWTTPLSDVDISNVNVTVVGGGRNSQATLILDSVNSSYCGTYTCSVMDQFTGVPSTADTTVDVLTGKIAF